MDLSRRNFLRLGASAAITAVLPHPGLAFTLPEPDAPRESTEVLVETREAFVGRIREALNAIDVELTKLEAGPKVKTTVSGDMASQTQAYSYWGKVNGLGEELSKTLTTKFHAESYAAAESDLFSQMASLRTRVVALARDYFLMGM